MTDNSDKTIGTLRDMIIADPGSVLNDIEVVKALAAAENINLGDNVIDARSVALKTLMARLERFREAKEQVVEVSRRNHSSAMQTHDAVLALLDAGNFGAYCRTVAGPATELLEVLRIKLILEDGSAPGLNSERLRVGRARGLISRVPRGYIAEYAGAQDDGTDNGIVLREVRSGEQAVYGNVASVVRSEALIRIFDGRLRRQSILAFGSRKPDQFHVEMGTDLIKFFSEAFSRITLRWLKN